MDIESMLGGSFAYAKDAFAGKRTQWLLLVIATILLCLPLFGYMLKILRGERPAPEITGWGTLFVDGIKYVIVSLVWAIPLLIILFVLVGAALWSFTNITAVSVSGSQASAGNPAFMMGTPGVLGLIVVIIVAILTLVFATIGIIRFARTGSMGEAFNFREISATIGKIGWENYIITLLVLFAVQVLFSLILWIISMIPVLGIIIQLVLIAPIVLFEARYLCQVYDTAGTA
jgi:hypothetical protein